MAGCLSPHRVLLRGVPPVHFYRGGPRCPEDVCFPSCLRVVLEHLGDNLGCRHLPTQNPAWALNCAYAYLMGTSGYAFGLAWKPGWDPGNGDIRYLADDPSEPFRRALASVGYSGEVLLKAQGWQDEALYREKLAASLRQHGHPVLALGVIGPPECCLVTGYDEGGVVLIGWSFFQGMPDFDPNPESEPTGEFRQRDWFARTEGLILVGERGEPPNRGEIYRNTLRWALDLIRCPTAGDGWATGLAAYDAWAEHLLQDEAFPLDDPATLWQRFGVHNNTVGNIAEARWYGALFLAQAANEEPWMAADLLRAAACLATEHDLMWKAWGLVGGVGMDETKARQLAEPAVRREMVKVVAAARAQCAEAAEQIACALTQADR